MSFKEDAIALLLKKGTLVMPDDKSYYWGWHDSEDDIRNRWHNKHREGCHWVASEDSKLVEKTYYEFAGTDCESLQETLLTLTHVSCTCGVVRDRRIGRQGSTGDLLKELLGIEVDYE